MDVADWLRTLGLQQYEALFRDNDLDAEVLPTLGADDLRELGITSLGIGRSCSRRLLFLLSARKSPLYPSNCKLTRCHPHPLRSAGS